MDNKTKQIWIDNFDGTEESISKICDLIGLSYKNLTEVYIPNTVTKLDKECFSLCESLKEVTVPDSVIEIGYEAFSSCNNLKKINLSKNLKIIGERAFLWCTSLKEVIIPDSVTEIGYDAFSRCWSLKEITLPSNITKISAYTFEHCKSLEKIDIPNSVAEIDGCAFLGCTSLKKITLPSNITEISAYTFDSCESLEKINIPDGVTEIGTCAFSRCTSLKEVTIPNSVIKINDYAFSNTPLKEILVKNPNCYISDLAFGILSSGLVKIKTIIDGKVVERPEEQLELKPKKIDTRKKLDSNNKVIVVSPYNDPPFYRGYRDFVDNIWEAKVFPSMETIHKIWEDEFTGLYNDEDVILYGADSYDVEWDVNFAELKDKDWYDLFKEHFLEDNIVSGKSLNDVISNNNKFTKEEAKQAKETLKEFGLLDESFSYLVDDINETFGSVVDLYTE